MVLNLKGTGTQGMEMSLSEKQESSLQEVFGKTEAGAEKRIDLGDIPSRRQKYFQIPKEAEAENGWNFK